MPIYNRLSERYWLTGASHEVNTTDGAVVLLAVNTSRAEDVLPRRLKTRVEAADEVRAHVN
jgi:hypothetical protein